MGEAARDVDAPVSQIKLDVLTECEPAIRGTGIRPLRAVAPPTPPPRSTSRKAATRQHVGPTA
ncbi:MAG: hypothetical protein ACRDRN_24705, partial [Sciscionella sp.]